MKTTYTPEEQAENRRKLVEALRSGEYQQGRSALTHHLKEGKDLFCCLGVACDLFAKEHPDILNRHTGETISTFIGKGGAQYSSVLPLIVRDWLGFATASGELRIDFEKQGATSLAQLNDIGTPFKEIADVIEKGGVELLE